MPKPKKTEKTEKVSQPMKKVIRSLITSEIGPEQKYHTTIQLATPAVAVSNAAGWLFYDTCLTGQALTDNGRVGDTIKIEKLDVKLQLNCDTTYRTGAIRVFMFQWHADNFVSTPANTDLFMTSISGNTDAFSPPNEDNKKGRKWTMLYDKIFPMVNVTADSSTKALKFSCPLKFARKKLQYAVGGQQGFDHIYIGAIADKTAVGTNAVNLAFTTRLYFRDS